MRNFLFFLIALLSLDSALFAQNYTVKFKTGNKQFPENTRQFLADPLIPEGEWVDGQYYRFLQFYEIPVQEMQDKVRASGIRLLEYIPHNTYLASIPAKADLSRFNEFGIRSIVKPGPEEKVDERLWEPPYPAHTLDGDMLLINLATFSDIPVNRARNLIRSAGIEVMEGNPDYQIFRIRIRQDMLWSVAALPFVRYLEMTAEPDEPEDTGGRTIQRSNLINTLYTGGIRFNADGVKVMVRDDGAIGPHIDFQGRVVDYAGAFGGTHGDGVAGVMAGAGNLDPTVEGGASGATVYVLNYVSTFTDNTLSLHQTDTVVITNSSYSNGCNAGYTTTTQTVDRHIYENPALLHVFSAGNSNGSDCGYGAGTQWGNITGGHKMGKNVMATANLYADGVLASSSSRGPAHDGRIKPDISGHGQNQISTNPNNAYQTFGGTSAAAPSMAGNLAQLYQAYKQMNGGVNPPSALIKACAMNSAQDYGNPGPDFKYGWGLIHTYDAYQILANGRYLNASISQSGGNTHNIPVPAGVAQLRIMAYWSDPEASVGAAPALVNNLDLTVTDPGSTVHYPLVLDPTPNPVTLDLPAVPGVDTLNNVEQVRINNPAAGNYSVSISGTAVPMGPQEYFIVYSYIYDEVRLTYPVGGEGFVPGESERLHWDAWGTSGTFTLEYSTNNGSNWNLIASGISASARLYSWTVPSLVTGQALVRVSRGAQSDVSDANFSIIGLPAFTVSDLCNGGVTLNWSTVSGANQYVVYQLGSHYMDSIATVAGTSHNVLGLTNGNTYWFSVQARNTSGIRGRRSDAVSHVPAGSGVCPTDDIAMSAIVSPIQLGMSCNSAGYSSAEVVTVSLQNTGISNLSGISLSYQLDGGPVMTESYPGTLNSGTVANFSFSATADMSAPSNHVIKTWLSQALDANPGNDTLEQVFSATLIPPVSLPVSDDFDSYAGGTTVFPDFVNDPAAALVWEVHYGSTTSTATGPTGDVNGPGGYIYMETSSPAVAGDQAILCVNCVDLSSASNPTLSFYYHMYGDAIGFLKLEADDGTTVSNIWQLTGQQQTANADPWLQANVDLSPYAGQIVSLCFTGQIGTTGSSFNSDISLDEILITDTSIVICSVPGGLNASGLTNSSGNLSWNPVASAASYNIRYRKSGTMTWMTDVSLTNSYLVSGLDSCSLYEWQVESDCDTAGTSGFSTSANFTTTGCSSACTGLPYCSSSGSTTVDEWAQSITVGPLVNNSGNNSGYADFTLLGTSNFMVNTPYALSLTPGYSGTIYGEYWRIWVDLNQDGDFVDSGELVFDAGASSTTTVTGTMTIPFSALSGITRMRVSMKYNTAPTECEAFTYGEVEDYCIRVVHPSCGKDNFEPNELAATAHNLYNGAIAGFDEMRICPLGDVDWYSFQINTVRDIRVRLENLPADYQVELHDNSGLLTSSLLTGTSNELILWPNAAPGTYKVRVWGNDGAWHPLQAYRLIVNTSFPKPAGYGIKPPNAPSPIRVEGSSVKVYPNPFEQELNLDIIADSPGRIEIELTDLSGRRLLLQKEEVSDGNSQIMLELPANMSAGVYLIEVRLNGRLFTDKLVRN